MGIKEEFMDIEAPHDDHTFIKEEDMAEDTTITPIRSDTMNMSVLLQYSSMTSFGKPTVVSSKRVTVGRTRECIIAAVKSKFGHLGATQIDYFSLQAVDPEHPEDGLQEIDDFSENGLKSDKIAVFELTGRQRELAREADAAASVDPDPEQEYTIPRWEGVIEQEEYEEGSPARQRVRRIFRDSAKQVPEKCGTPSFPPHVQHWLNQGCLPVTAYMRKQIMTALVGYMEKWVTDKYPTPLEYTRITTAFLEAYPFLADATGSGQASTWRMSLVRKWKEIRHRDSSQTVLRVRQRFTGRSGPRAPRPLDTAAPVARRPKYIRHLREYGDSQTAASHRVHMLSVQKLWTDKVEGYEGQLDYLMNLTAVKRRHTCLTSETLMWSDLQEEWPPLERKDEILKEVRRQLKVDTGANRFRDHLLATRFGSAIREHILSAIRTSSKKPSVLVTLDFVRRGVADDLRSDMYYILAAMPHLSKEPSQHWLVVDEDVLVQFPVVKVTTTDGSFGNGAVFVPHLNGQAVCTDEDLDMVDAFWVLASALHLANLSYGPACPKAWAAVGEVFFGLPPYPVPATPSLHRLKNLLY